MYVRRPGVASGVFIRYVISCLNGGRFSQHKIRAPGGQLVFGRGSERTQKGLAFPSGNERLGALGWQAIFRAWWSSVVRWNLSW